MTAKESGDRSAGAGRVPQIEIHSIDYIPERERHGHAWQQGPFWFVLNLHPFTLALGLIGPSLSLSMGWTVLAGAVGLLLGTVLMAFHAAQGPRLGLPQMVQSRPQFGYRGAITPMLVSVLTFGGFFVLTVLIIAQGLKQIFGWNTTLIALIASLIGLLLAVFGHDWLHWIFRVLFVASLPLWLVLSAEIIIGNLNTSPSPPEGFTWVAFMVQFTVSTSYTLTYAPSVSDYTRYLPSRTSAWRLLTWVVLGTCGSSIWLMALGAWTATRLAAADPIVGIRDAGNLITGGFGSALALLSVGILTATVGFETYSAALSTIAALDSVKPLQPTRRVRVAVSTLVAVICASITLSLLNSSVQTTLSNILLLLLYLIVPWSAVNLVDFFLVRRGRYAILDLFTPAGIYGSWAWRGLVAYTLGLAAEVPFFSLTFWSGPGADALSGVDIAFAVGLTVAAILYFALSTTLDLSAERPAIARSNDQLASQE
ncbi:cytosine permease [Streptomyces sp. NPDC005574]|uniref:purine-cytosine permease family protein n=1 Tax=Streptomyces sp. NPDC005574 TaxID=3156891 RepID=UPI0033A2B855